MLLATVAAWAFVRIAAFDVPAVSEAWQVTGSFKDVSVPLGDTLTDTLVFGPCLIGSVRLRRRAKASPSSSPTNPSIGEGG